MSEKENTHEDKVHEEQLDKKADDSNIEDNSKKAEAKEDSDKESNNKEKDSKEDSKKKRHEEDHKKHVVHHKKHATHKKHKGHKKKDDEDSVNTWLLVGFLALIIIGVVFVIYGLPILTADKNEVNPDESIVALVNGKEVTMKEVNNEFLILSSQYPDITKEYVINQTIKKRVLLEEALEKNYKVDEEEIDIAVEQWATDVRKNVGDEALISFLEASNMTIEEYIMLTKRTYKEQALIFELLNETVLSKAELKEPTNFTSEMVENEFNNNKDSYVQRNVSFIWVCYSGVVACESNRTKEEAIVVASGIYDEIINGADFEEMIEAHSTLPELKDAKGTGVFTKEMIPEDVSETVFTLNKGEISEPIDSEYGFFISRVNEVIDDFEYYQMQISINMQFQEQMKLQQENTLIQQEAMENYISTLMNKYEVRNLVKERKDKYDEMTEGIVPDPKIKTFSMKKNNEICTTDDGRPIIYLFSTTWCPHCKWITDTFNGVADEYNAGGKVLVKHWELDIKDDILTEAIEGDLPVEDLKVYQEFNPKGSVPFYVFGCKYYRSGNGYEGQKDLRSEEAEFRAVIDRVIAEAAE